jgi:hypothetical protein
MQAAITEALARDVPHPNAVRLALERARASGRRPRRADCPLSHARALAGRDGAHTPWPYDALRPVADPTSDPTSDPDPSPPTPRTNHDCRCSTAIDPTSRSAPAGAAHALRLMGLLAHWDEVHGEPEHGWPGRRMLAWEEAERAAAAWSGACARPTSGASSRWPTSTGPGPSSATALRCEELMTLDFMKDASNVVLVGPNGVGKSMWPATSAPGGAGRGTRRCSPPPGSCWAIWPRSTATRPARRLRHYAAPDCCSSTRWATCRTRTATPTLLFELVSRRYQHKSTVVTTNRAFAEWGEVFPNAACVVSLIDRLVHRAEVVRIEGESYRPRRPRST